MFKCIGKDLNLPAGFLDFDQLLTLPLVVHEHGTPVVNPHPDDFYWLEYKTPRLVNGHWRITRNLSKFLPEFSSFMLNFLSGLLDYDFKPERLQLALSIGSVCSHRDDGGRKVALNVGLFNSNSATTKYSTQPRSESTLESFEQNHESCVCQDGHAYLLDTANIHEVVSDSRVPRLMATYSFDTIYFESVVKLVKVLD